MNNKARVSLVILSAALLSACTAPKTPGVENQAQNSEQNQSSSLRDLLSMGQTQTCTFSTTMTDENKVTSTTQATVYISGEKLAEEIQTSSTDKNVGTINMRMISDGTYMYSWDTSKKMPGVKILIPTPGEENQDTQKAQNERVDLDQKVDMKCSPWVFDNSKFTLPTDVQFTDLSELMKNIPSMPANIPSMPANLPGVNQ